MRVRALEHATFLARLERDVATVLGDRAGARIAHYVAIFEELDRDDFEDYVASHIQQEILDTHAHTAWPPCPAHPRHPLWYSSGAWRCSADSGVTLAVGSVP
jgi:hypothetical protein